MSSARPSRGLALLLSIALTLAVALAAAATPVAASSGSGGWLTAWSAAQQDPGPVSALITDYDGTDGRTVRNIVRSTAAGDKVRVRLTNLYGSQPLTFDDVQVGLQSAGAAVKPGSTVQATFGGRTRVTIPVGESAVSDAVARPVRFGQRLTISSFSSGPTGTTTTSGGLLHTNYISEPGNHASDDSGAAFTTTVNHWYFLTGVDVIPKSARTAGVVALGSSSTAGTGSTPDAGAAWPDVLADRLHERYPRSAMPVLNEGVPGNTLHESSPCYGDKALARMNRDVFAQHGVRYLVLAIGSNDLTQPTQPHTGLLGPCDARTPISARGMIKLYKKLIARAHSHDLKVFAATISPFGAYKYWSPAIERKRLAINRWMLNRSHFDAVADFAKAVADPTDPATLNPDFDSGDGLHPNDAGYEAQAGTIPLGGRAGLRPR